jgi:hypothetical protein
MAAADFGPDEPLGLVGGFRDEAVAGGSKRDDGCEDADVIGVVPCRLAASKLGHTTA